MATYEEWITGLRLAWMGTRAKRIFGGFAAALGDRGTLWARTATLEHFPTKCSEDALPLIGADRLIPRGHPETVADYRVRLSQWITQWHLAGTALGLLIQLYFDGYTDAVIVQQNGLYHRLTGAPDLAGDPTDVHEVGSVGTLIADLTSDTDGPTIPWDPEQAWWTFDSDTEFCSRFAILLPSLPATPAHWTHIATVEFTSDSEASADWSTPFDTGEDDYVVMLSPAETDEGFVDISITGKTETGITLSASASFTGTVHAMACRDGENPFCCPSDETIEQLRQLVRLWKPAKATCMGVFALSLGRFWGWPVATFGDCSGTFGDNRGEVTAYEME